MAGRQDNGASDRSRAPCMRPNASRLLGRSTSFLFGSAREVRVSVSKVITRLKRGGSLEAIAEASALVDLARVR